MNIPLNGRIAIVDDKIDQAIPLMNLFSKIRAPFIYYDSNIENLPDVSSPSNDTRLLFLDINLIDDSGRNEKEIKSKLYATINRIISENNHPYLLIYWSRHESENAKIVEDLFKNELKNKAPIDFLSLQKSDYFELNGDRTALHEEKIPELFGRIKSALSKFAVYNYLLCWENLVHSSANHTLEEIFNTNHIKDTWNDNSQYLFFKLANSYAGKNYNNLQPIDKIKSGFYSLNFVFNDSLEYAVATKYSCNAPPVMVSSINVQTHESVFKINTKLLFADERLDRVSPGIVSMAKPDAHEYSTLLHSAIIRDRVFEKSKETICGKIKEIIDGTIRKKTKQKIEKEILDTFKDNIKSSWVPVEINVTPICDFAQGKEEYTRIIPGLLIELEFRVSS